MKNANRMVIGTVFAGVLALVCQPGHAQTESEGPKVGDYSGGGSAALVPHRFSGGETAVDSQPPPRRLTVNTPGREPGDHQGEFPLFQVLIRPASHSSRSETTRPGAITVAGSTLRQIVSHVYRVGEKHIECPVPLDLQPFVFVIATPDKREDLLRPLAQHALETTFGWETHYETRETREYYLEAPNGPAPGLRRSLDEEKPSRRVEKEVVTFRATRVKDLCKWLGQRLGKPVGDRTKLRARYDFELKVAANDTQSLTQSLRDQLGLKLGSKKRIIEFLLIEPEAKEAIKFDKPLRPLYQITIKDTDDRHGRLTSEGDAWRGNNVPFQDLVALAFDTPPTRVVGPSPMPLRGFQFTVVAPEGRPEMRATMLLEALELTFDLKVALDTVEKDSWVLSVPDPKALKIHRSSAKQRPSAGRDDGKLTARNHPIARLASQLETALYKPVVDETGLKDSYDWNLIFAADKPESLIETVREALGLKLTRAKRNIEVLVIHPPQTKTKHRRK